MGEGATALKENDLAEAEKNYRMALGMKPNSPEALEALAGTFMQAQQYASAEQLYASFVKVKPSSTSAWRGLFMAQYQSGNGALAIQTDHRMPAGVHSQLMRDPLYLRTLASAYSSVGRDADAQRVLHSALDLPFPPDAKGVKVDTQLQYAALLQAANHLDQAAGLYRQALAGDPTNANAWKGLVGAEHAQAQDQLALQTIESMPPTVYDSAMGDPGFEQTVASIYQSQNKYDIAQELLEKALAQQTSGGQKPAVSGQLQLAGIYMQRGNTQQAYPIYQRILSADPTQLDAWKGLLTGLHSTGRDQEALAQIQQIPPQIRVQLESDVSYLQTVGSVYAALNDPRDSQRFLVLIQQHYAAQHSAPPADIDIQDAWLLFNGGNDAGLYRELMQLGGRPDLTDAQRRTVQTIWANWAVRRANQAAAANHIPRSIEILNAAARAFPDNPGVAKALAGGYAKGGYYKGALTIWKAQDMSSASASDYKAAVGVALAAGDSKDAETWLRFGLNAYPKDAQLLILGAKFEMARGDSARAAEYYRASLTAMPPPDPGAELAYALSHYTPSASTPLPSTKQAKDLAQLLQPGINDAAPAAIADQPIEAVDTRPYLPSYNGPASNIPVPVPASQYQNGTQYPNASQYPNGYPYQNGNGVVPSYMSNPNPVPTAPTQPKGSYSLKDYVPQASVSEPLPADATAIPGTQIANSYYPPAPLPSRPSARTTPTSRARAQPRQATEPTQAVVGPDEYQRQQIILATQRAEASVPLGYPSPPYPDSSLAQNGNQYISQNSGGPLLRPGSLTQNPTSVAPASYQPQQQGSAPASSPPAAGVDEFGHPYTTYVPYVPTSTPTSYQVQAPVPVDLGATQPVVPTADPTLTDVLPVAKNVPNAHSRRLGTQHPDIAAANAAAIRRNQSNPLLTGISVPPPEADNSPPTQNTQYNASSQMNQTQLPPTQTTNSLPQAPSSSSSYQGTADQTPTPGQQYPQPNVTPTRGRSRARTATAPAPATQRTTASGLIYPSVPQPLGYQPYPPAAAPFELPTAPTDADLVAKQVPPLRNNYSVLAPTEPGLPLSERAQTERDLAALEAAYSGWIGGTGIGRYRSGRSGLDRLTDLEASFEASGVIGHSVRATIVPTAVFLSNGTANMADYTGSGSVLGTYQLDPDENPNGTGPAAQYATGVGGELQLTSNHIDVALGYTPYQFLVNNITGRVAVRLFKHLSLFAGRDAVKETQLSYAGLRDPGTVTPIYSGNIWGGVVQTGGGFRFDFGNERSGFYFTADGADLTGYHVLENTKAEGSMGAYFLVHTWPGIGKLNIGAAMFGEHYNNNQIGQTYGVGGYFSPEAYFLAAVPITFSGTYKSNFHYNVAGSIGIQTFEEDNALFFPLDRALQTSFSSSTNCTLTGLANHVAACAQYPIVSNTGLNYGLTSEASYRITDHWFVGGYLNGNNTNNYNTISGGFFVRYLFRQQYPVEDTPTGMFPYDGFRPLRVP